MMIAPRERLMSETKRFFRTWGGLAAVGLLLLAAVMALTGCGGPAAIAAVEPTATVYALPPTDIPAPPPGPTPEALDFPLQAPSSVEQGKENDQSCVDCHTDEETLKAVAEKAEVAEESLSEGEG
jgi:hypothetical protein